MALLASLDEPVIKAVELLPREDNSCFNNKNKKFSYKIPQTQELTFKNDAG